MHGHTRKGQSQPISRQVAMPHCNVCWQALESGPSDNMHNSAQFLVTYSVISI